MLSKHWHNVTYTFKALLFDLDDTLVNSSEIVRRVMEMWCLKNNIALQSVLEVCRGGRTEDTVALVAPHLCARTEAAEIDRLESKLLAGLKPIDGAGHLLKNLGTFKWAIVTSSSMQTAKLKLEVCGMPVPSVMITAESVSQGKPHPEPFLTVAKELNVRPEECLVFEDADNGVHSAIAAGCRVVIVGDRCVVDDRAIIARVPSFNAVSIDPKGTIKLGETCIHMTEYETGLPSF